MAAETSGGSRSCFRCGAGFGFGELRYRIDILVAADTGGEIDDTSDTQVGIADALERALEKTDEELEREVHTDFRFYLCEACKDEYLKGPEIPLDEFFFGR
jgi:hypothetical protein